MLNILILGTFMKYKGGRFGWSHFLSSASKIKNRNHYQPRLVKGKTKDCYPFTLFRQFCLGRPFKSGTHLGNGLLKTCFIKRDIIL